MFIGGVAFLVVLVTLAGLVLLVMALVDLVRRPAEQWTTSGHNQLVWALIVIFDSGFSLCRTAIPKRKLPGTVGSR